MLYLVDAHLIRNIQLHTRHRAVVGADGFWAGGVEGGHLERVQRGIPNAELRDGSGCKGVSVGIPRGFSERSLIGRDAAQRGLIGGK